MGENPICYVGNNDPNVHGPETDGFTKIWHNCMLWKIPPPTRHEDYRPLTLLNADFKLLARIIANRILQWINDLLHPSKHCGVQENNISGTTPATRNAIAHAELSYTPVYIPSLDFNGVFVNIAQSYLFAKLESCGFSSKFRQWLMRM